MLTGFQVLQHSASSVEAVQKIQVFYTQKVELWAASKASDMIPFISPVCPSVGRFCLRDRVTSLLWLTHSKLLITIIQLQSVIILLIIIHFIYRCILVQKISNIDTIRHGRNIKLQLVKNMNLITAHHVKTQVPSHLWSHQHADALQVDRGRHIKYIWMEVVSV